MVARVIIGANYGDEGKGTVVARYTKESDNVLNVLTNGGPQRGHSILTEKGSMTFQHFGSGTFHGADNHYSRYFILNPMQFVNEYNGLLVKPKHIYRDPRCKWTTPYDVMANLIQEEQLRRKASCGMGIWNTIKRFNYMPGKTMLFDMLFALTEEAKADYLRSIRRYYDNNLQIPDHWKDTWYSPALIQHFLEDCAFMLDKTEVVELKDLSYENLIFENGQGLLLSDTGKDTYDTTPSDTGIRYALELTGELGIGSLTAHYVTRPYLTRHGDGEMMNEKQRKLISKDIMEDRTNHDNEHQGGFRYGKLDINSLYDRIVGDARGVRFQLELTHCDEMDRLNEFKMKFGDVNTYDTPLV